jgi:predicted DCC family thiol-disulfide oxidoreductase YuxK
MVKNTIIYDGECGFCNRFIVFIAKNDTKNVFLFTPNHSDLAKSIFEKQNINPKFSEETNVINNVVKQDNYCFLF